MVTARTAPAVSELPEVLSLMEVVRQQFIGEALIFIKEFWYKKAMEFLNTHPQDSKKLDDQARQSYLRDLDTFLHSGKEGKLREILERKELWWHLDTSAAKPKDFYKDIDNMADEKFRQALGEIGSLLFDYGLIWKSDEVPCFGFLSHKTPNNLYTYTYIYPVYWSDGMKRRMDNYWENFKYAEELQCSIQSVN